MFSLDLWKEARKQIVPLVASVSFGGANGALIVWQAWILSKVISGVFLEGFGLAEIQGDLVLLTVIVISRSILVYGRDVSAGSVSIRVRSELKQKLFSHLLKLSPIQIQRDSSGDLVNTLIQGVGRLDAYFRVYLPQLGMAVLVPVLILVVVFPVDWLTAVIFFITAPLIPIFMILIGKEAEKRTDRQWRKLGRLSSHFLDVLQGLRTLKAFGLSKRQGRVIESVSEEFAQTTLGVLRIAFLSALVLELLATISTAIVAVQIGLRLLNGQISFTESLFVLILAPEFYLPLRQLGAAFHSGMEGISAAESVIRLGETASDVLEGGVVPVPVLQKGSEIRFEQVTFSYQQGERPSLKGVDVSIPIGEYTALVGPSGSGKSTMFALLLGFISPDSGTIMVGRTSLADLDLPAWRAQIGWVPQMPYLYFGSIYDNVRVANPHAAQNEVIEALKQAKLDEFITSLPDGLHTQIGERGIRLSGGQAQRIAIARAILRNPRIFLLDEPSSSLDVESVAAIHESIDALKVDRTVVTISHQRSRTKNASKIIVIDDGRVKQTGRYDDLISAYGKFASLFDGGDLP